MYDGGFSENLAALPLIQRRMKNIIIVDAENDAAYKFPSYAKLKKYLWDRHKITLGVKTIDDFLSDKNRGKTFKAAAVSTGSVKYEDGTESTVYYIKMSRPDTIFGSKGKGLDVNGKPLPEAKRSRRVERSKGNKNVRRRILGESCSASVDTATNEKHHHCRCGE